MIFGEPVSLDSVPPVLWKNGGGITRSLVAVPEKSGINDFEWRVSLAEIKTAGGFSAFPGVDRTILLWRGDGVVLRSPQWPEHRLIEALRPFEFRGEDEVHCDLAGGLTEDLNLMVRRGCAHVELRVASSEVVVESGCRDLIVLCSAGRVLVRTQQDGVKQVEARQMLRVSAVDADVRLVPEASETCFVFIISL